MTATLESKLDFLEQADRSAPRTPAAWKPIKQKARLLVRELPYPTARTEDWRFTNVSPLLKQSLEPASAGLVDAGMLPPLSRADALRLTFVNGWFVPQLSNVGNLPAGVLCGNLAGAEGVAERLTPYLAHVADDKGLVFTALNTALLCDGAYLIVPDRVVVETPIEVLYVTHPGERATATHPRTLVVAGKGAQATVVERYLGFEGGRSFVNAVTEIALADGALVDHVKIEQENLQTSHFANTQVVLARGSNFTTHSVLLGGGLVRNEVRVRFDDENGEATVNGLYHARGSQHIDNHTVIDHAKPHCNSHELYKGVLAEKAHGVFNGKIFVRKDAQKTDAKQTNKVLLLSDDATINTKPQLEIFADDVKCTHGATVGQLAADQLFYLQSRGIGHEEARRLLTFAFANDVVGRIKLDSIREEIEAVLVGG